MSKITGGMSGKKSTPVGDVPRFSKLCSVNGCNEQTDVSILLVVDERGKKRSGPFSKFGTVSNNGNWNLRHGYTFDDWVTRCAKHYMIDADRNRERLEAVTPVKWLGEGEPRITKSVPWE